MRTTATIAITLVMALLLGWQHTHGGVPSHHLLADPTLPSLSNWWGLLSLPLLSWYLLGRIERRRRSDPTAAHGDAAAFAGALVFGALLALLFTAGQTDATEQMVLMLPLLALFYPIHRAACVLGFVIGTRRGWGDLATVAIAVALAYVFGYVLTLVTREQFIRRDPALPAALPTGTASHATPADSRASRQPARRCPDSSSCRLSAPR